MEHLNRSVEQSGRDTGGQNGDVNGLAGEVGGSDREVDGLGSRASAQIRKWTAKSANQVFHFAKRAAQLEKRTASSRSGTLLLEKRTAQLANRMARAGFTAVRFADPAARFAEQTV